MIAEMDRSYLAAMPSFSMTFSGFVLRLVLGFHFLSVALVALFEVGELLFNRGG
jgi:hypothetical protein